jgi:lipopolysaccharide/colanic/teichoic acid biosynthesis glycosyltransferase
MAPLRKDPDAADPPRTPARQNGRSHPPEAQREPRVRGGAPAGHYTLVGHGRRNRVAAVLKRATDLLVATLMLVCLSPLFVVVALAIRLDSPGPVLFRQRRIGRDGREFTMLKFRSMSQHATHEAHHLYVTALAAGPAEPVSGLRKLTGDSRVTRAGAIIRKTSIDEGPQLLNVIAAQMSIVGPRPAVRYELELYRPEHFERFGVRPGITGLWQVSGRARLGFNEMLDLDVEYARHHGFWFDLWIMLRTPLAVLRAHTA